MKKRLGIIIPILVVIIVIGVWQFNKKKEPPKEQENNPGQNNALEENNSENGNVWLGTLKKSDNAKKGNLMLILSGAEGRVVYIHTSRDYSALIDKPVAATIDGTFESFRLIDIVFNSQVN